MCRRSKPSSSFTLLHCRLVGTSQCWAWCIGQLSARGPVNCINFFAVAMCSAGGRPGLEFVHTIVSSESTVQGVTRSCLHGLHWGLFSVYNLLPQVIVDAPEVKWFQSKLQHIVKHQALVGSDGWDRIFSPRPALYSHSARSL